MYGRLTMTGHAMAIVAACAMLAPGIAAAQEQSLASTLEVYVFPAKGQGSSQQSEDEAACYQWAVSNTGTDPFEYSKQEPAEQQQAQAAQQAGRGSGAGGAVAGAAAGALIGEIAHDDASEGAAWGAAVGAIAGRRRGKAAQQQATAQAQQQAAAQEQAMADKMSNFKKAFSVCLEGKNYLVKY